MKKVLFLHAIAGLDFVYKPGEAAEIDEASAIAFERTGILIILEDNDNDGSVGALPPELTATEAPVPEPPRRRRHGRKVND